MCDTGSQHHFTNEFNVIYLRVVQGCNLNCSHCFTLGNRDKYQLAPLSQIGDFLGAIKREVDPRKAVLYIHGGEPFLAPLGFHREVNQLARTTLGSTEVLIIPQTNLMYRVDDEFVDFLKEEYNGQIGVSWDFGIRFGSTSSALNEELFLKNFRFLAERGIEMAVAITVQRHLLESNPIEVLKKLEGARSVDFEFLTMFDEGTRALKVRNEEWAAYLQQVVEYYAANETTWSLPQVDLMTKSFLENKIFKCKCNCCQNRTFTMNCNGTVGLCPDETYVEPFSTVAEMRDEWGSFVSKAALRYAMQLAQDVQPICGRCEFFDVCGGNCEPSLFAENDTECPLSRRALKFQFENLPLFKNKLERAYENLPELKKKKTKEAAWR